MRCALGYLRGYQREAAGAVAALLLVAAANLATPQLIRVAIDVGFTQAQPSVLAETVAGLSPSRSRSSGTRRTGSPPPDDHGSTSPLGRITVIR